MKQRVVWTTCVALVLLGVLYVTVGIPVLTVRVEERIEFGGPNEPAYDMIMRSEPLAAIRQAIDDDPTVIGRFVENGKSLLAFAAQEGRTDVVALLLERGAQVDGRPGGESPLVIAVLCRRMDIVRSLLEHGADPGAKDLGGRGMSAYRAAESEAQEEMLALLRDYERKRAASQPSASGPARTAPDRPSAGRDGKE